MKERTVQITGGGTSDEGTAVQAPRWSLGVFKASHGEAARDGAGVLSCGLVQSLQDPATVALGACRTQSLVLQRRRSALG